MSIEIVLEGGPFHGARVIDRLEREVLRIELDDGTERAAVYTWLGLPFGDEGLPAYQFKGFEALNAKNNDSL